MDRNITVTEKENIDQIEAAILEKGVSSDFPVVHRFTPGLYIRETTLPADSLLSSATL